MFVYFRVFFIYVFLNGEELLCVFVIHLVKLRSQVF